MQADGQSEVAKVVGSKLDLPALGGAGLGVGHDTGVVDEDVERVLPRGDECLDGGLVREVQQSNVDVGVVGRRDHCRRQLPLGVASG